MKGGWKWAGALVVAGLVSATGCSEGGGGNDESEQGNPGLDNPGPGTPGGDPAVPVDPTPEIPRPPSGGDGGTPDAGPPGDGGTPPSDGGTPTPPPTPPIIVPPPSAAGWQFFGRNENGPEKVYGVASDEDGNIWVAGGEEGLFLLKSGTTRFQKFTMTEGLRPYGYLPGGGTPTGAKYLKVVSVAGGLKKPGASGMVFVGYEGMPGEGANHCENNWDGASPDPSRYKSGDADKVTLLPNGTIATVHYDIFSGPDVVRDEPRGREKVCNILRIAVDKRTQSVWFGGNHGFAWGSTEFEGNPACNGQHSCAGLYEHVHPAINAFVYSNKAEDSKLYPNEPSKWRVRNALLTDAYYGVAVDPSGDVWFGGADRSTRFRYVTATGSANYWRAQSMTEDSAYAWNRYDIWKDAVAEGSRPEQRISDSVSSMAVANDGTVWVGSFANGVAQLNSDGALLRQFSTELTDRKGFVSSLAADPLDGSVWAGTSWGGGISRIRGNTVAHYNGQVFGVDLAMSRVSDIQVDTSGAKRRVLVGFMGYERSDKRWVAGSIGIYSGD
ncbi:hypothetical protein POL68_35710 [Stigmatella sp. ncwal1]|uniref:Two component regulator propeller n=1 Tax=Stigmatella ashevillensis TaxID=2995309 RepID=A0ABT5DNB7_9BACT|nr:hypothetical protein [Stigmatella ashevillena]MDC0713867.1 hypothetical protein [Stigmatella ashevillena]